MCGVSVWSDASKSYRDLSLDRRNDPAGAVYEATRFQPRFRPDLLQAAFSAGYIAMGVLVVPPAVMLTGKVEARVLAMTNASPITSSPTTGIFRSWYPTLLRCVGLFIWLRGCCIAYWLPTSALLDNSN